MGRAARRRRETVRFLKWTRIYSGWWQLICTPGDEHMDMRMMKLLIEKLEKEKFYEIIFVLCMVHRNREFMTGLSEYILKVRMIQTWETDAKAIINEVIGY